LKLSLTSVPSEFCPRSYTTSFPSFQLWSDMISSLICNNFAKYLCLMMKNSESSKIWFPHWFLLS
jgi:hypothetical protein